jgi:hypothetical protein
LVQEGEESGNLLTLIQDLAQEGEESGNSLTLIQDLEQEGEESGNLLGGLTEAQEILIETNQGKKFNRVLIMYTDGLTALSPSEIEGNKGKKGKDLHSLQREFIENGVLFYLLVLCDQSRDDISSTVSDNLAQYQDFVDRYFSLLIISAFVAAYVYYNVICTTNELCLKFILLKFSVFVCI